MSRIAEVAVVFLFILTSALGENGMDSEHQGTNPSPSNGNSSPGTTPTASSHLAVTGYSPSAHQETGTLSSNVTYSDNDLQNATADSSGDFNSILEQFIEYRMYKFFVDYFVYVTSVPGLVTNPLTIYLAFKITPQGTSELYMKILGATDLLNVIMKIISFQSLYWTDLTCKVKFFIINISYTFSNWIIVSWTVERFIAVVFPLKLNIWCTVYKVRIALGCLLVACVAITIPHLIYVESLDRVSGGRGCVFADVYYKYYSSVENVWYMYLPMLIVFVGNAIIIYRLRQMAEARGTGITKKEMISNREKEQRQITKILITVSCTFIGLHIPQLVAKILEFIYPNPALLLQEDLKLFLRFSLIRLVGYQITDFQNSINFFLYCASGSKVRQALQRALVCRTSYKTRAGSVTTPRTATG